MAETGDNADVVITVGLAVKDLQRQVSSLEAELKKQGEKAGKGFGDEVASRASAGFAALRSALLGVAAVVASGAFLRGAIREAVGAEEAINNLSQSLRANGTFSTELIGRYQAFASELQRTTKFGDDATIGFLALANNLGFTGQRAEEATKAAIALNAAFGISVDDALKQLNGTLEGSTGRLAKLVPELGTLSKAALQSGDAIEVINRRLGGSAEAQARTFGGSVTQLSNAFGDFLQSIGEVITKSPLVIKVLGLLRDGFLTAAEEITKLGNTSPIDTLVIALAQLGSVLFKLIALVEMLGSALLGVAQLAVAAVALLGDGAQVAAGTYKEIFEGAKASFENALNPANSQAAVNFFDAFIAEARMRKEPVREIGREIAGEFNKGVQEVAAQSGVTWAQFEAAFKSTATNIAASANSLAATLKSGLVTGLTNSFAAFGNALGRGEDAFAAFGKSILSSLGDILINVGQMLIAIGIGFSQLPFLFGLQGFAAVAAGVAAVALGGLLKGLAGAGGGGGAPGAFATQTTPQGAGFATPQTDFDIPDEPTAEQRASVQVVVQGNVLDRRETGLALAEIIAETVGSNSLVVQPA